MKVLQIHNEYRLPGGEDVMVHREAELLRSAGHEVVEHVVSNPENDLGAAGRLVLAPWNPGSRSAVSNVVGELRPDVAHVHNTWFTLSPSVVDALADSGVPAVMSLHNYRLLCINGLLLRDGVPCALCVGASPADGVRYRCYRDSYAASAMAALTLSLNRARHTWDAVGLFLANSSFVRDTYLAAGFAPERVAVKPNFTADPGPRTVAAADSDVVLYVGRLSPEKGAGFLVDLWRQAAPRDLRLKVVGEGPELDRLRALSSGAVEFVGGLPPEQVAMEMAQARALFFPSLTFETCPLVILEAFASGLPVVATAHGAMSELVAPLGEGWLRAPGDPQDWEMALGLISQDEPVTLASRRARQTYERSFTPAIALDRLEMAYARARN